MFPTAKKAPEGAGDIWTWTALDADNKLIISWAVGGRDADDDRPPLLRGELDDERGRLGSGSDERAEVLH